MLTLDELRTEYRSGPIRLVDGKGGLPVLEIRTELAEADVYLHGAHVTHFRPAGQEPVLFVSSQSEFAASKTIRGGVPVCFPWFGPKKDNPMAPAHGIARMQSWSVQSITTLPTGEVGITLQLTDSDLSRTYWPFPFELEHRLRIGRELSMTLATRNTSVEPFTISEALHTYFAVGDVRKVSVTGLANTLYMDKTRGMQRFTEQAEPLRFTSETDRHYLNTEAEVIIHDPVLRRRIRIAKTGSMSTVVWNPWVDKARAMSDFGDDEWPEMLCVETANAADNAVAVAPNHTHTMQAAIIVQAD